MTALPDFKLEKHFSRWEFTARYNLAASDAQSMSLRELLDLATPAERAAFDRSWLGYTETFGAPDLREAIAATYEKQQAGNILCFAGAEEGLFAAMQVLLDRDSHAIVEGDRLVGVGVQSGLCQLRRAPSSDVARREACAAGEEYDRARTRVAVACHEGSAPLWSATPPGQASTIRWISCFRWKIIMVKP